MCTIGDRMAAWEKQHEEATKYYERLVKSVVEGRLTTMILHSGNVNLLDVLTDKEKYDIASDVIADTPRKASACKSLADSLVGM